MNRAIFSTIKNIPPKYWVISISSILILCGIIIRVDQFLFNRSLWLDEAFLAHHLATGSWADILSPPLEFGHFLPPGFIILVRSLVEILGNSDLVLRIVPLLFACLALLLFYLLAKQHVDSSVALLALFFLATSNIAVFYASELKPYAGDMFFGLLLWLIATPLTLKSHARHYWKSLAIVGVLSVWFSHAAIFMLAGIGSYFFIEALATKNKVLLQLIVGIGGVWLLSFFAMFFLYNGGDVMKSSPVAPWLHFFFHKAMPSFIISPWTESGFKHLLALLKGAFQNPGAFEHPEWAAIFAMAGLINLLYQKNRRIFLLILPVIFTLIAASLEKYPFAQRFLLFLAPVTYLLAAQGIVFLAQSLWPSRNTITVLIAVALTVYVTSFPLYRKQTRQEVKPVLKMLQQSWQPGDKLFLYYWAVPAFQYYAPFYGFNFQDCHIISEIPEPRFIKEVDAFLRYRHYSPVEKCDCMIGVHEFFHDSAEELTQLSHVEGRLWVLFNHFDPYQRDLFLSSLNNFGTQIKRIEDIGVSLHLYEMKN